MYIHSLKIQGFKNFTSSIIEFKEGVNVIIGHNNAGKSNLLKAISLVIDPNSPKKLDVEDFNKNIDLENLKQKLSKGGYSSNHCRE